MIAFCQRVARRVRSLVTHSRHEQRMADEMRYHLEMETAELGRAGVPADEAFRQACIAFGGVERFKEEGRTALGTRLIADLGQDLRYATRQLRASPGFAAATVLTLALGVGATTMMQSFRRSITAQESTIASPERLVSLGQGRRDCPRCVRMAAANYLTIRNQTRSLEHVAMFADWEPILRGADHAELVDGARVTTGFFQTFAIRPLLGRTLVPADSASDRHQVVVLSERFWQTRFHGDRGILGQTIILDRKPYAIVGVIANGVLYPRDADLWTPLVLTPADAADRTRTDYRVVGRLHVGGTVETAVAELKVMSGQLAAEFPAVMGSVSLSATPILALNAPDGDAQTSIFTVAVWLVLLIACINLAGLLIARLSSRRRELAVRRAMGAEPGRIVRQLLVETMLLTVIGGACGAVVAVWGLGGLIGWSGLHVDARAFAIALAMGLVSGLVIGLWPAVRFARPILVHELRDRASTGGANAARGRRVLVGAEIALAIVLLSAAGLLARSFQKMWAFNPGFSTEHVLTLRVKDSAPDEPGRIDQLVRTIEAVPGVERAGATLGLPFGHGWSNSAFAIEGQQPVVRDERPSARMQATTPGYFVTLGIPLLRGRAFTERDRAGAPRVAIVNQAAADRFFPGENPVGRAVVIDSLRWEIVGVVGTVFTGNFEELAAPDIYRPLQQWERHLFWIAIRTRGEPAQAGMAVAAAVRRFDPDIAITRTLTMDALRLDDLGSERMVLRMMAGFALAALLISAIGLYGLISYSVAQRTREFGVRLALGASGSGVLRLVLGQGVRMAAIGATVGIAGAIGVLRVMQAMLFRVSPADPVTLAGVAIVICSVALCAAYIPARRAMRVDPMTSLREE